MLFRLSLSSQLLSMLTRPLLGTPLSEAILNLNRNARAPKKANHGARPCSSVMRRYYNAIHVYQYYTDYAGRATTRRLRRKHQSNRRSTMQLGMIYDYITH